MATDGKSFGLKVVFLAGFVAVLIYLFSYNAFSLTLLTKNFVGNVETTSRNIAEKIASLQKNFTRFHFANLEKKSSEQNPFCQRADKFITFSDISETGSGLMHKYDDVMAAIKLAFTTNRTLVDYAPRLLGYHALGVLGKENGTSFYPGWKVGDFFDITSLVYTIYFNDVSDEILNIIINFTY